MAEEKSLLNSVYDKKLALAKDITNVTVEVVKGIVNAETSLINTISGIMNTGNGIGHTITNGIVNAGSGIINHYIQQAVAILEDQCSNGAYSEYRI